LRKLFILMPGGFTAFPGYQMKITNIVESGDWVVVESRFTGTHTGPLVDPGGSIPATDVEAASVDVFEVRGGKIVAHRGSFDNLDLMAQLAVVPAGAATTS
jgi:predicted ester cyclase